MFRFILILLFILFIYFYIISLSYKNEFKLQMVFGKKGAGKTTYLTSQAIKYNKMGWQVFSNTEIYNTFRIDTDDIGKIDFPPYSLLLLDEVGMVWDNRNFKNFPTEVRDFFKLQRHKKVKVILASQTFDIDKKLRDLTDEMYLLTNFMRIFTLCKRINKTITIHNGTDENNGDSFLTEAYKFDFFFFWKFIYVPRYVKFFNSFECDKLPDVYREKYKYENDAYLYKLTHYRYYLKDKLNDIANNVYKKIDTYKKVSVINVEYTNNRSMALYYDY